MPVADARVADGVQDGQMVLELVNLGLDALSNAARAGLVVEGLGQFVHRAPHVADFLVNILCIQFLERTFQEKEILIIICQFQCTYLLPALSSAYYQSCCQPSHQCPQHSGP